MTGRTLDPEDRVAITALVHAYCERVDAADADGVAALFTEDAVMDFGLGRLFEGRAAVRSLIADRVAPYRATSHHLSNVHVRPDDAGPDRVAITSYIHAWHERADGSQPEIFGRYYDTAVRESDGAWRIARRDVRAAGWRGFPTPSGVEPFERIERAGRESAAPSPAPTANGARVDPRLDAVLDVMGTARAVRRFTDEPVTEAQLEQLIWAATRAPNPRNVQPWEFVVVRDATLRHEIGALLEPRAAEVEAAIPGLSTPAKQRMYQGAADLIRSIGTAPALVFVCYRFRDYGPGFPPEEIGLSAAHTAAQNIALAANAMGLGTTFTTFHLHMLDGLRALLRLPEDVRVAVTLPIGHPATAGGPVRRRPIDEVLHWDRFDGTP